MTQDDIKKAAKRLLDENANITELHATADGNLFTDAKKAARHNSKHVKKDITVYNRKSFPKPKNDTPPPAES